MNNQLQEYARNQLKVELALCTEGEQHLFKRMYSPKNLELDIESIVDLMDESKLDWAMTQVKLTLYKKTKND